jgi:hypothetical protein
LELASTQQWRGFPHHQESYQTPHLLDEKEVSKNELNSFVILNEVKNLKMLEGKRPFAGAQNDKDNLKVQ